MLQAACCLLCLGVSHAFALNLAGSFISRPNEQRHYAHSYNSLPREKPRNLRANIDPYATLTPSERLRAHADDGKWHLLSTVLSSIHLYISCSHL